MILKWLILGVIIYVVYIAFFKSKNIQNSAKRADGKGDEESEDMVECSVCGTFVSKDEAFIKNGKFYCSKECMLKG